MISVPVYEAKTRLSELLQQAQQGEVITITRHGVPAGQIVGIPGRSNVSEAALQRRQVDSAFEALSGLRRGMNLDMPLREAIDQGRD